METPGSHEAPYNRTLVQNNQEPRRDLLGSVVPNQGSDRNLSEPDMAHGSPHDCPVSVYD